jgi:hypothetical protein
VATRKSAASSSTKRRSRTTRRTSSGALYPRRRRSRPGLPTTVGTALGALVVTTLLDLSWPLRIALLAVVLVVGLAYVLWRHRGEIAAAEAPRAAEDTPAGPVAN